MQVGIQRLKWRVSWNGHRSLAEHLQRELGQDVRPLHYNTDPTKSFLGLRQRVAGAKTFCSAPERAEKFMRLGSPTTWSNNFQCLHYPAQHGRKNQYDGIMEYWITTREHGSHAEEHEVKDEHKSKSKACRFGFLFLNHLSWSDQLLTPADAYQSRNQTNPISYIVHIM